MDASYSGRVFIWCSYGFLLTPGKDSYLSQDYEAGTIADIVVDKLQSVRPWQLELDS